MALATACGPDAGDDSRARPAAEGDAGGESAPNGELPDEPGVPDVGEPVPSPGEPAPSPLPDDLDPSTITFEWPEGESGSAVCRAGRYLGTFEGIYTTGGSFPPPMALRVTGSVQMFLHESQQGEFFEVRDGVLDGHADTAEFGRVTFQGEISGELDCPSGRFEARLENGEYQAALFFSGSLEGPLYADYDHATATFVNGTWDVGSRPDRVRGGTWTASHQP